VFIRPSYGSDLPSGPHGREGDRHDGDQLYVMLIVVIDPLRVEAQDANE
jgi:hypothetical protein